MKRELMSIKKYTKYKTLLYELVSRDLKVRYRRSVLGMLWTMLTPILSMLVMTVVFSKLFRFEIENYVIYLLTGNIIFSYFNDATTTALWSIVENAGLLKKIYLPKAILPVSKAISNGINLFFSMLSLILVMLITRTPFHLTMVLIPVGMLYIILFAMGFGIILSTLAVFFRDICHLYSVITLLWMYATPIFYPVSLLQENAPLMLKLNPVYHIIHYFRLLILDGRIPSFTDNMLCLLPGIVILVLGSMVLHKMQKKFILYI